MDQIYISGYSGAYPDPVTGGYPLGNGYRIYLPELMRFAAPDDWSPFGQGGINPYAYCADDPVNYTDPSGHVGEGILGLVESLVETIVREEDAALAAADAQRATRVVAQSEPPQGLGTSAASRRRRWSASDQVNAEEEPASKLARLSPQPGASKQPVIPQDIRESIGRIRETLNQLNQPTEQRSLDIHALNSRLRQDRDRVNAYFKATWVGQVRWQWSEQDAAARRAFDAETEWVFLRASDLGTNMKERILFKKATRWKESHRAHSEPPPDIDAWLHDGDFRDLLKDEDWATLYLDATWSEWLGLQMPD